MLLKEMSDEDLIFLINRGSKSAETTLYQRYSVYARHQARKYLAEFEDSGISEDELYAVAFSKVHESLTKFDEIEKVFYVYWKTVARNAIYDYVRKNSYKFGAKEFAGVSFDDYRYSNNYSLYFSDVIGQDESDEEMRKFLEPYIEGNIELLTNEEKLVAKLKLFDDYSRKEIQDVTGLKMSRVNYLLSSATKKLQQLLKENYL